MYTVYVEQIHSGDKVSGFLTDGGELVRYPTDGCCEFELSNIAAGLEALVYDGVELVSVKIERV